MWRAGIIAALLLGTSPALAEGDAAKGERQFRRCAACHAIGEGAKNRVGPALTGIIERVAGTDPSFRYSDAMRAAGAAGLVWNAETLDAYLQDPRGYVAGTRMMFPGMREATDRADLIAYLATFSAP